ncbi:MAG TPA: hypothetical protein DHW63_12250 [Hyphomonadaceae bacterium]|nr:hypothetical protein [Hyphomonadaceae bacterium]
MFDLSVETIAFASAGVHVLGYAAYIGFVRRGQIDANPLSWLMFAYGTGLLTFLEYRSGASWVELLLPIACSLSSVVVAALCVRATRIPKLEFGDVAVFCVDVALTLAYVGTWFAARNDLTGAYSKLAVIALLVCANLTTVTAFVPILRSTLSTPSNERVLPWLFWTGAYALLFAVTMQDVTSISRLSLLLYPGLNAMLHFAVALLAMSRWWRPHAQSCLETREAGAVGIGLFTTRAIRRGGRAFVLSGQMRRWESRTQEDAG